MTITRVHYREGQILRIADLRDEQTYRIQMRRRHNLAHHGWGIVQGLELRPVSEGVELSPGMAIDGFGRELFVPQPVALSSDIFNQVGTKRLHELDLWLLYRITALMPQDFARCREEPVLWLTPAADIDPRCPRGVPEADLVFGPHLDSPDDPTRRWPVYLGRLRDWTALDSVDILDVLGLQKMLAYAYRHEYQYPVCLYLRKRMGDAFDVKAKNVRAMLVTAFNQLIRQKNFYDPKVFDPVPLRQETKELLNDKEKLTLLNRQLLEDALQTELYKTTNKTKPEFVETDILDAPGLQKMLTEYLVGPYLREQMGKTFDTNAKDVPAMLVSALNKLLNLNTIYDQTVFESVSLQPATIELLKNNPHLTSMIMFNHLLLEDALPTTLKKLIDDSRRPYLGPVGQLVTAPSGSAQMQVGSEAASRRERFAVRLRGENQTWNDWLTLDRKGNLALKGDTAIEGELAVARDIHFDPLKEPPAIPAPWQVYYTIPVIQQQQPAVAASAGAPSPAPIKQHQLRFEILHPGDQGEPSSQQFVIGKSEQAGSNHQFQPCLTVDADGTVKMKGNVLVEGQVVESPIKPDVSDPRFGAALIQSWVQGQGAAATQSDVFQATKLLVEILLDPTTFPTIPEYKVELTNTGNINITNIQIFEVLTSASKSYDLSAIGSLGFTLGAGSPQRAEDVSNIVTRRELQLGQDTKFTLTVTAIGAGPGFLTQATDSKQVTIAKTN